MTNAYLAHSFVSYHVTPHYIIFIYIIYIYLHKYLDFLLYEQSLKKNALKKGPSINDVTIFFQFSWPLFPACRYFSFQCGINFSSVFHTPLPKTCNPPPSFEDGDVIYGRPLKMPFIFSAWTFSCQRQKKKQKQNIKTNKQKNKQMGKRSKRAIYYTTIIMLTGKNKRRKLMVALRIVQKEIFFILYLRSVNFKRTFWCLKIYQ